MEACLHRTAQWGGWASYDVRRLWTPRWRGSLQPLTAVRLHLGIRTFLTLYAVCQASWNAWRNGAAPNAYLSYLTNQSIWLVVMSFVTGTILSYAVYWKPALAFIRPEDCSTPARKAACWLWRGWMRAHSLLHAIALPFQLVVVVLFWTLLAPAPGQPAIRMYDTVESHGVKFALIWLDFLLSCQRLLDRDGLATFSAAVVYLFINLGYTRITGTPVYPVLSWQGGGSAVVAIGALIFVVVSFYLAAGFVGMGRDALAARVNRTTPGFACCASKRASGSVAEALSAAEAEVADATKRGRSLATEHLDALYPLAFADEAIAWPCATCACCYRSPGAGAGAAAGMELDAAGPVSPKGVATGVATPGGAHTLLGAHKSPV